MKFKVIFIVLLFLSAALVGAGFGFMEVNRIHRENNTIHFPSTNYFNPVDSRFVEQLGTKTSQSFTLVGNVQFNDGVLTNCYDQNVERFYCSHVFDNVSNYLNTCTNLLGSLNGVFAGETATAGNAKEFGYAEYTCLNAPNEFVDLMTSNGFTQLAMANSHVFDAGGYGITATLDAFYGSNTKPVGIFEASNQIKDGEEFEFGDSHGVMISCTEEILDKQFSGHEYSVNFIKDEEALKDLCRKVKQFKMLSTDAIVVYYYFANQKDGMISDHQRAVVNQFFDAGADIIIGTNPDIIEPMEVHDGKTIMGKNRKQIALYSLGSLMTGNTKKISGIAKNIGMIARFTFTNDGEEGYLTKAEFTPTYCVSYPTTESVERAGAHVNVFSMMEVVDYINNGGSNKSSITVTKPAVKARLVDMGTTTEAPVRAKVNKEDKTKNENETVSEDTEESTQDIEVTTEENITTEEIQIPENDGGLQNFFGILRVGAKENKPVLENEEFQSNLTKNDFMYIDKSWEMVIKRFFGEYKYEKTADSVWFTLKNQ